MPWSRRKKRVVGGVGIAAAATLATAWILLAVPIAQEQSGYTILGYRLYSFEAETLSSGWSNFTYRGVSFALESYCAVSSGGGEVCGNVIGQGTIAAFHFWESPPHSGPGPWQTWVAPNGLDAIQFEQVSGSGDLVHLLVAT